MASLPRPLHPATNAPGLMAAAGAVYAAAVMLYNAHYHHGVISAPVLVAGAAAVSALLTRFVVTPTADPKDGAGNPLVPAPAPAPAAADAGVRVVHTPQPVGTGSAVIIEEIGAALEPPTGAP